MPVSKGPNHRPAIYLGIDPGAGGGLAALFSGGKQTAVAMPVTEADLWAWFRKFQLQQAGVEHGLTTTNVFAIIEQVHSMPRDGHVGVFSFGKSYGMLIMALTAAQIPYEQARPQEWQKELNIKARYRGEKCKRCEGTGYRSVEDPPGSVVCPECKGKKKVGGETDVQWKNRLKAKAQQLFPQEKVTLATADALLIAEYGRRKRTGTL